MHDMNLSISALAHYLDVYFGVAHFPGDQNGIYRPGSREVRRIGLALEPWAGIGDWVQQERLDALFLHRPWHLDLHTLPEDVGVLGYHLAFDSLLTLGFNTRLATILQMTQLVPIGTKEGMPLGMLGQVKPVSLSTMILALSDIFGTPPDVRERYVEMVERVAVVGAMTDELIRNAAHQQVQLYVTGQFRQPARQAVAETRMTVATIGHVVSERWGLRALGSLLRERWAHLHVLVDNG